MNVKTGLPATTNNYPRQLYQAPIHTPPKRTSTLLDDAEIADRGRRLALLNREIVRLQDSIANRRQEMLRLLSEIENGSDIPATCGLCGLEVCVCERLGG